MPARSPARPPAPAPRRTILGVGTLYYQYDLAGRRALIQEWTGDAVYYTYGNRGLISTVHSPAGWAYYQYDPRGAPLSSRRFRALVPRERPRP